MRRHRPQSRPRELGKRCPITNEEWVAQALAEMPPISPTKAARLALILREDEPPNRAESDKDGTP